MKTYKVEFLKSAKLDMQHANKWYNLQRGNLGYEFISEIEELHTRLKTNPKQFPKIRKDIRKAILKRFPYSVYYIVNSNRIRVFAVLHNSRNPITWMEREKR
jgi:plasmid stabilization system protein ParE